MSCFMFFFALKSIDIYLTSAAIATVVTIAEILKNNGLAIEKSENLRLVVSFCFEI